MVEQLQMEIEQAKQSLQEWQRKEREAVEQVRLGRGYLQGLQRALEVVQGSGGEREPGREGAGERGSKGERGRPYSPPPLPPSSPTPLGGAP